MLTLLDHWRRLLFKRHLVAILILATSGHVIFGNTPLSKWKQSMTEPLTTSTSTTETLPMTTGVVLQPVNASIYGSTLDNVSNKTVYPQSPMRIVKISAIDGSVNHNNSSALLPLLPWEILSLKHRGQPRRWRLPPNVHSSCALGSIPKGGRMANPSQHCPSSEAPYQRLYNAVRNISNSCDVCTIVDLMSRHNMTLSLWGDSLQMQVFDGLHCALERQGYLVEKTSQRLGRITDKMTKIMTLNVYHHLNSNHSLTHNLTIRYFAQYKPKPDPKQIQEQSLSLMQLLPHQQLEAHILLFNFGLHWRTHAKEIYHQIMNATLTALQSSDMFLVYRETTTQHFDTEWGEYPIEGGEKPFVCRPILPPTSNNTSGSNRTWREDITKHVATELGYEWVQPDAPFSWSPHTIMVAPFRDFVAEYHDLHPDECTHFCYTPHLWIPVWKSLAIALAKIGEFLESQTTHS